MPNRHPLRRSQTKSNQSFIVVAETLARVSLDQLLNPFEIGRRRKVYQVIEG